MAINDEGIVIDGNPILRKSEYEYIDQDGVRKINWKKYTKYADEDGFDIRNKERNGSYKIVVRLPKGTMLIRYGKERGSFTAPDGTSYEKLSLPYVKETVEFHRYLVVADSIKVECVATKGRKPSNMSTTK